MKHGLGGTTDTQAQITATAQRYGVDPRLALAVAKQESGYQQTGSNGATLTSGAGALGIFQLMPATAKGLGVDPNDQSQNITGGVKLLAQLLNQYKGNVSLALAAYNAGPGAVSKYGGVPPYAETQNYVSSIMANYKSQGGTEVASNAIPLWPSDSLDSPDTPTASDSSGTPDTLASDASSTSGLSDSLASADPIMLAVVGIGAIAGLYLFMS